MVQPATLGITVISPLQQFTIHHAVDTAGYAVSLGKEKKDCAPFDECRHSGVSFIPLVVESFVGWNVEGLGVIEYIEKLQGLPLGLQTYVTKKHLFQCLSVALCGNVRLIR